MTDKTSAGIRFNTDALLERDRFPAFCEEIIRRYTGLDITTEDELNFHATIELQRVGMIDLGTIFSTPVRTFRSSSRLQDGDDALIISLPRSGLLRQTQRGVDEKIESGEAIISDCRYRYIGELNVISRSSFWNLKVPRSKIANLPSSKLKLAGTKLDKDAVALRLLFGYLDGTYHIYPGSDRRAVMLYEQHIVDLVALALGAEGDTREQAELGGARVVRQAAILHEIETRISDSSLNATAIARHLGITPRYVHRLLEETGQSFTQHLLERRLDRAFILLGDPKWHDRKISDIAREVGFSDISHFNHTFRRRFGDSPSGVRVAVRQRPYDER